VTYELVGTFDLDPRWEWVMAPRRLGERGSTVVRGACNHLDTVDVESVLDPDVILARLCLTCDTQLDAAPAPRWASPTTTELHAGTVTGRFVPSPVIPTLE
jgi:hypothetical protein